MANIMWWIYKNFIELPKLWGSILIIILGFFVMHRLIRDSIFDNDFILNITDKKLILFSQLLIMIGIVILLFFK